MTATAFYPIDAFSFERRIPPTAANPPPVHRFSIKPRSKMAPPNVDSMFTLKVDNVPFQIGCASDRLPQSIICPSSLLSNTRLPFPSSL